jgi:hypothetical protein
VWFNTLQWLLNLIGNFWVLLSNQLLTLVGQFLSNDQAITVDICARLVSSVIGVNFKGLNKVNVIYHYILRTFKSSKKAGRHGDDVIPAEWACLAQCAVC